MLQIRIAPPTLAHVRLVFTWRRTTEKCGDANETFQCMGVMGNVWANLSKQHNKLGKNRRAKTLPSQAMEQEIPSTDNTYILPRCVGVNIVTPWVPWIHSFSLAISCRSQFNSTRTIFLCAAVSYPDTVFCPNLLSVGKLLAAHYGSHYSHCCSQRSLFPVFPQVLFARHFSHSFAATAETCFVRFAWYIPSVHERSSKINWTRSQWQMANTNYDGSPNTDTLTQVQA